MKKFESERNALFSVILGLVPRIHAKHLANVILGFIPRIHYERSSLDSRDTPENDRDLMVDTLDTPEYDKCTIFKGLDVVRQCATLLERLKTHIKIPPLFCYPRAWLLARPEDLDSRVTPENDYKVMQCGRSMIEMLGVLAIIGGLSVGGIAGYSKAMETYKINQTKRQLTEIITNIQTLYMQQKDFNSLGNYTAVQTGIVPDDLKTSVDRYGITNITNAFGSPVIIAGYSDYYIIRFLNVTKEGCTALATADWGNSASSGLVAIGIGFITGESDTLFEENQVGKNCTSQGVDEARYSAYYACANHLPLSPALAAQHCIDTGEDWGYDNSFTIMISK